MQQHKKKHLKLASLYNWHRYLGVSVAIFVIFISLTGLVVNHGHDLSLDEQHIQNTFILDLYGIEQPDSIIGYRVGRNWVSHWGDRLFFNSIPFTQTDFHLQGITETSRFIAIATTEEIWLVTIDGEIIEKLTTPSEKLGDIEKIGTRNDNLYVRTTHGTYRADHDIISWRSAVNSNIAWSLPDTLPHSLTKAVLAQDHSITVERFLLDIHSGRILPTLGIILFDLAGIIMTFLAISGLSIWYTRRKKRFATQRID